MTTLSLVLTTLQVLALVALVWAIVMQIQAIRRLNRAYEDLREVLIQAAREDREDGS